MLLPTGQTETINGLLLGKTALFSSAEEMSEADKNSWMVASPEQASAKLAKKIEMHKKFMQRQSKFNSPVLCFSSTDKLPEKLKDFLHALETRSESNYGDCRWYTKDMMEFFKVSRSTIDRYLQKLEKMDYISIISKPYHNKGKVYQNRVIRCKRIWMKYSFRVSGTLYKAKFQDIRMAKNRDEAMKLFPQKIPKKFLSPKLSLRDYTHFLIKNKQIDGIQFYNFEDLCDSRYHPFSRKDYHRLLSFKTFNCGWELYQRERGFTKERKENPDHFVIKKSDFHFLDAVAFPNIAKVQEKFSMKDEFNQIDMGNFFEVLKSNTEENPTEEELKFLKRLISNMMKILANDYNCLDLRNFRPYNFVIANRKFIDVRAEKNIELVDRALEIMKKYRHRTFVELFHDEIEKYEDYQ